MYGNLGNLLIEVGRAYLKYYIRCMHTIHVHTKSARNGIFKGLQSVILSLVYFCTTQMEVQSINI